MQKTRKWLWPLLWYEVCTNLDPRINGFWILVVLNPFPVHDFDQFCNKSYRTGGTKGTGTVCTFGKPKFTPVFLVGVCVAQSFVFCVVFYIALFVLCPFSFLTISIVCILCPSSDFGFSFHLWCLQTFLKIGYNKTNVKMFIKTKNGNTIVFVMEQYWEMKFLFYTSECMAHWDYLSKLTHYSTFWYNHQCYQNRQYWEMKFLFYTSECMAHCIKVETLFYILI